MDSLHYDEVEGAAELKQQLLFYWREFQAGNLKNTKTYYILFHMGAQQSLIRVDVGSPHFYFWYYDLLGRPMTKAVKQALAEFLWEHNGQKQAFISAMQQEDTRELV